ncbi:YebC/PmpR family DNA-binding transcriptional regulator [bacterium]|nr:YebC/PmpR family DNA-binding transcriptional regulator [bacterium]|tara:strand:- start:2714 stop:3430 length:717 start_codon:yes stop_codon:yes gene_type:complete
MAGHSKWHSIRHKKGANDKKRGKIFTKHARLIMLAARNGGDPSLNSSLRQAIENAKAENVPNDNIKRAIAKGSSEGKDATQLHEVLYEGYGPDKSAILIEALTDNKNRTFTNIRNIMNKNAGNLGASGSVAYMFEKVGFFHVKVTSNNKEEVMLEIMELDPLNIIDHKDLLEVTCKMEDFANFKKKLDDLNLILETSKLNYISNMPLDIETQAMEKVISLIEKLEEDDDVLEVYTNLN